MFFLAQKHQTGYFTKYSFLGFFCVFLKRTKPFLFFVTFLLFIISPFSVQANSCSWTGTSSTDWATSGNWSSCGGTTPQSTDDVTINGGTNQPTLNLSGGSVTINSLSLGSSSGSTLTISNGDLTTPKKLIITANATIGGSGTLTHTANTTAQTHSLYLDVGGDLTINSGGKIDVSGKGYTGGVGFSQSGNGPGKGYPSYRGSGSGYGGDGGYANFSGLVSGGISYGSVINPVDIGSGGGGRFISK